MGETVGKQRRVGPGLRQGWTVLSGSGQSSWRRLPACERSLHLSLTTEVCARWAGCFLVTLETTCQVLLSIVFAHLGRFLSLQIQDPDCVWFYLLFSVVIHSALHGDRIMATDWTNCSSYPAMGSVWCRLLGFFHWSLLPNDRAVHRRDSSADLKACENCFW